jgi:cell division protease FtsH
MAVVVPEALLPHDLTPADAVEAAYGATLSTIESDLLRGLPVLLECEKDLAPWIYMNLRGRLRRHEHQCLYLDGRPRAGQEQQAQMQGLMGMIIAQLRDAVRGAVEQRVVVLPHLDLLTTSSGGLTTEAKEVIPLLYENPELVWLGFKDPSFPLPRVIENLFPHRYSLVGLSRDRLRHLVTQSEARKFGPEFNPWALYKYVSGINAVRLRKLLATLEGEDYPLDGRRAYGQIRQATAGGTLEIPEVHLERDIGGYPKVKQRLRNEILDVLDRKDQLSDENEIRRLEELIPKGMIFWGPPGTGKTLFAKAIATSIGAAITIVSGPELKSKWVGESEENLRQIFHQARQSAPSIIVFDELDSFASARGSYTGSGVEHSMVNQLLTEMDGFHREEMVFVVGTTNFVEALDPALLRPGRFEFHLHIPYPDGEDRRQILRIWDRKLNLAMTDEALEHAVRRTSGFVEGQAAGSRYSGDHLNALCRSMARLRLRENRHEPTSVADVERGLTEYVDRPQMTSEEERVVATHEAGHAVVSLFLEHSTPIERISIQGDSAGALGFVRYQDVSHRYVITQGKLLDDLATLMGGREAELLFLDDVSIGASGDLDNATAIARALVEEFGLGGKDIGLRKYLRNDPHRSRQRDLSPEQLAALDRRINEILAEACERARAILKENHALVETLRDLLLEHKVIDAKTLADTLDRSAGSEQAAIQAAKETAEQG